MATASQKNKEQLIRIEGEIALLKHEIQTISGNHLAHLDQRVFSNRKSNVVYFFNFCHAFTLHSP